MLHAEYFEIQLMFSASEERKKGREEEGLRFTFAFRMQGKTLSTPFAWA